MRKEIAKLLKEKFEKEVVVEIPKDTKFGEFSTPVAFSLAKEYRKSPIKIAEDLVPELQNYPQFEKVEAVKGFLNFYLSEDFLNRFGEKSLKEDFGQSEKNEKILLEFVSANPTGPLHIGHARGAIYGDSLLRLGRHLGYKIDSEYYVNDAGRQISLLGVSIKYAFDEISGKNPTEPEEYYRGEYIFDLAKEIQAENGDEVFSDLDKLSVLGKNKMILEIKSNLSSAGIEFDSYVSEKEIFADWEKALEKIGNGTYQKDGKTFLKSSEHGDDSDRVIVRENGIPTYLAGDITYHNNKFSRDYDKYINIWGADHHGYIKRVESAIEFLGYDSSKLETRLTQMVSLLRDGEPYKMSKRAGNFILMKDVVDEVGADALRFIFASKTADTSLTFDISDLMKQDSSNPIYYINYAHARVHSLLRKSEFSIEEILKENITTSSHRESRELLFFALRLPEVIEESFESRGVQKMAEYLHSLASNFHSFYNKTPMIGNEKEKELLKLSLIVANSIKLGLSLLGISAKEKM
ncbi:arginyl-tRNA synthetase [Thiovulum sp. ES]|nr:arginyl-tRNA synthetase [Thiovulum sp. ES]